MARTLQADASTCRNGHIRTPDTSYFNNRGRICKICQQVAREKAKAKKERTGTAAGVTVDVGPGLDADVLAAWRRKAACPGSSLTMDDPDREAEALALCADCPVLRACRAWVLKQANDADPGGVCGGMTEKGRKKARWMVSPQRARQVEAGLRAAARRRERAEAVA